MWVFVVMFRCVKVYVDMFWCIYVLGVYIIVLGCVQMCWDVLGVAGMNWGIWVCVGVC